MTATYLRPLGALPGSDPTGSEMMTDLRDLDAMVAFVARGARPDAAPRIDRRA